MLVNLCVPAHQKIKDDSQKLQQNWKLFNCVLFNALFKTLQDVIAGKLWFYVCAVNYKTIEFCVTLAVTWGLMLRFNTNDGPI
jgi:hypothetical protein